MTTTATETHPIEALRAAAIQARSWARAEERRIEAAIDAIDQLDEPTDADYREQARLEALRGKVEELLGSLYDVRQHTRGLA